MVTLIKCNVFLIFRSTIFFNSDSLTNFITQFVETLFKLGKILITLRLLVFMQIDFSAAFDRVTHVESWVGQPIIRAFSMSSQWVLEVQCYLYCPSFYHSTLWWVVFGGSGLTLCQKFIRAVFGPLFFLLYTLSFFPLWK